ERSGVAPQLQLPRAVQHCSTEKHSENSKLPNSKSQTMLNLEIATQGLGANDVSVASEVSLVICAQQLEFPRPCCSRSVEHFLDAYRRTLKPFPSEHCQCS